MYRFIMVVAFGLASVRAEAHAMLHRSTPSAGASLTQSPSQLDLFYSEGLEPAFSAVIVTNALGGSVAAGPLHLAPDDDKHAIVPLKPLAAGSYHVEWHVTSVDTHRTQGAFDFSVGAPGVDSGTSPAPAAPAAAAGAMADMPGMK